MISNDWRWSWWKVCIICTFQRTNTLATEDPRSLLEICKSICSQFIFACSLMLLSSDDGGNRNSLHNSVQNRTFSYFLCLWFFKQSFLPLCLSETNNAQCHSWACACERLESIKASQCSMKSVPYGRFPHLALAADSPRYNRQDTTT